MLHLPRPSPVLRSADCSGNPPNVSAMATIESDWDGQLRELGTSVLYTCLAGLETATGVTEQTVNCTGSGWQQEPVLPCDGETRQGHRELQDEDVQTADLE